MSDETPKLTHECPSRIELSAWLDNESAARIGEHLKTCPMCHATVEQYRRLDQAVKAAVQPSPQLINQIKTNCRQQTFKPAFLLLWPALPQYAVRLAALVVLLLVVTGLYLYTGRNSTLPLKATSPTLVKASVPVAPETVIPAPQVADSPPPAPEALQAGSLINTGELMAVSTTGDAMDSSVYSRQQTQPIPDYVRHVWIVNNLENGIKTLKAMVPADAACEINPEVGRNRAAFVVLVTDRQIQSLVDGLAGSGFSLVSPALPQPGEKQKVLVSGKTVLYDVEIVPGNNP